MDWLEHFVSARHGHLGTPASPQTRGLVLTSGWRYDLLLWLGNLAVGGKWQQLRQRTADLAQLRPGETVLDVGCGTGMLALLAKPRVDHTGQVCGIDPSASMIARSQRKAVQHGLAVDFQVGLIEQIPFPDRSFDVVLSTFMMHVLRQRTADLKHKGLVEIARVLRPGGRLLVVDTKRPETTEARPARMVHVGPWQSGVQDQPALMAAAGFVQIGQGDIDTNCRSRCQLRGTERVSDPVA
jgi:SAM-dependent methyltransferase